MSWILVDSESTNPIFFPDANILLGLIFDEARFGGSNRLFLRQVRKHQLECTILLTVQNEVNDIIKSAIDNVGDIMDKFLYQVALAKTDINYPTILPTLELSDTPLLENAFDTVFRQISGASNKNDRLIAIYDWVEAWILLYWSDFIDQGTRIDLEEFRDRLKQIILQAYRHLDDAYQKLKLDLHKSECDWNCERSIEQNLKTIISDPTDIPHIALAISYLNNTSSNAFYVTNDFGVLKAKKTIEKKYGLIITRAGFAYAYYKMNSQNV